MATPNSFILLITFLFYSSSLLLILSSCFLEKSLALENHFQTLSPHTDSSAQNSEKSQATDPSDFHTFEIDSLISASNCEPLPIDSEKRAQSKTTLAVYHRHDPCSPINQQNPTTPPSLADILHHDQLRVQAIQARRKPHSYSNKINGSKIPVDTKFKDTKFKLPVQSGEWLSVSGSYVINISLGTPAIEGRFVFDTASDLVWVNCTKEPDPLKYNPNASATYLSIPCNSPLCTVLLPNNTCSEYDNIAGCEYSEQYNIYSYSKGFFSIDQLSITQTGDSFPNFMFLCGQYNSQPFGNTAGSLGLGRDNVSFLSQTAETYWRNFSYCIPSIPSKTGFFTLGQNSITGDVKYTPLVSSSRNTSLYFINITSITIGKTQLPINTSVFKTAGAIIDSATEITRLPPAAFNEMNKEFTKLMISYHYSTTHPYSDVLNTCYDVGSSTNDTTKIKVPRIYFTFENNVKVELDFFWNNFVDDDINSTRVCLAFTNNSDPSDVAIFGSAQQKTLEVVYDVDGGKLGFRQNACS